MAKSNTATLTSVDTRKVEFGRYFADLLLHHVVLSWIVESWEFFLINTSINYISGKQNGTPTTKWNSLIGREQLTSTQWIAVNNIRSSAERLEIPPLFR
jgi:hypothetical protein